MTQVCRDCQIEQPIEDYYLYSSTGKPAAKCKKCANFDRTWRNQSKKKVKDDKLPISDDVKAEIIKQFQLHVPCSVIAREKNIEYHKLYQWRKKGLLI